MPSVRRALYVLILIVSLAVLVLPGRSSITKPLAANALNKALEGLTFDMDPLTIHDLRRTGATLLTEKGFNRDVIEKALSHEKQGIRAVYILAEHAAEEKRCCNGGQTTWTPL
jgi:integrase